MWLQWTLVVLLLIGVTQSGVCATRLHNVCVQRVTGEWSEHSGAELVWATELEGDVVGFWVYRIGAHAPVPMHTQLHLIDVYRPGGSVYRLTDPTQVRGGRASYRIDVEHYDGVIETAGIWDVCFEDVSEAPVTAAAALHKAYTAENTANFASGLALKVPVVSNDLFAVSFSEIATALAWSEEMVSTAVVSSNLSVRCGESTVAYLADTDREQILFYGWPVASRYAVTNYFWIEPAPGIHMSRRSPVDQAVASNLTFISCVNFEEEHIPITSIGIGRMLDDLNRWDRLYNSYFPDLVFDLPLYGYASGPVDLKVRITCWFDAPGWVEVWFNGSKLGDIHAVGTGDYVGAFTLPGTISATGNQLTIRGAQNLFYLDGFDVEYARFYEPVSGLLHANDGSNAWLSAAHFSDPLVVDVTNPFDPVWIADAHGAIPSGWSWSAETNTQWVMREWGHVPVGVPEPAGAGAWLRDSTNMVDYLVIAPRVFEEPARELAAYRFAQGLRTTVALYEEICDQFQGGVNSPEAIHAFLSYAYQHWSAAPSIVVLGGWGHYDYLGVLDSPQNYLPALLGLDSVYMRPADGLLADVVGDDEVPEFAIGRLPVQSTIEFFDYINKLKRYEARGRLQGHTQMIFAADVADEGGDFTATNLLLSERTALQYTNAFATRDSSTVSDVNAALTTAFTSGVGVVHYSGHGSYQQLSVEKLFTGDEAASLSGDPVPLFIALTCLSGRFDIYDQRCLAESLVLNPVGGALLAFSPAGLSWNYYAAMFADELYRLHCQDGADTIGPLIMKTRQSFGVLDGLHAAAFRTYNLLGDPAVKLQGGSGGRPADWISSYSHWRWEKFAYADLTNATISGTSADPTGSGQGNLSEYAFGGHRPGLSVEKLSSQRVRVGWKARAPAKDLTYQLRSSTNLNSETWMPVPRGMASTRIPLDDGIMEQVNAEIPSDGDRLFLKLDVVRE